MGRKLKYSKGVKVKACKDYEEGSDSFKDIAKVIGLINGIEFKDYDPKGDIYTMKSRKTTFEERVEIVKWIIENNMSYKNASDKYSVTYALVYRWTKIYLEKGP